MTSGSSPGDQPHNEAKKGSEQQQPDWADGLRQLYDSVVDEPLPDAFMDLLSKLDEVSDKPGKNEADGSERGRD